MVPTKLFFVLSSWCPSRSHTIFVITFGYKMIYRKCTRSNNALLWQFSTIFFCWWWNNAIPNSRNNNSLFGQNMFAERWFFNGIVFFFPFFLLFVTRRCIRNLNTNKNVSLIRNRVVSRRVKSIFVYFSTQPRSVLMFDNSK